MSVAVSQDSKPLYFSDIYTKYEATAVQNNTITVPVIRQAPAPVLEVVGEASSSTDFFFVICGNVYKVKLMVQLDKSNNILNYMSAPDSSTATTSTTSTTTSTTTTSTTTTTNRPINRGNVVTEGPLKSFEESTTKTETQYLTVRDAIDAFKKELVEKERQIGGLFETTDVFYRHFTLNYGHRIMKIRCSYFVDMFTKHLTIYCLPWKKGIPVGLPNNPTNKIIDTERLMEATATSPESEEYDENEPWGGTNLNSYVHELQQTIS